VDPEEELDGSGISTQNKSTDVDGRVALQPVTRELHASKNENRKKGKFIHSLEKICWNLARKSLR